jgi:hypothetical protein
MKLFWYWQSNVPGNIGRHFVQDALAAASGTLNQLAVVEEASEAETTGAPHIRPPTRVSDSPHLGRVLVVTLSSAYSGSQEHSA